MASIYETVRNLEITKVKCSEVRTNCKIFGDKLDKLDTKIRISLNFLPDRAEALTLLTEASAKTRQWASEMDYIINKLDVVIREMKVQDKIASDDIHGKEQG